MEVEPAVLGGAYRAQGPFFPRQPSGTIREIDAKIQALEKSISLVQNTLLQAKGAFFWCAVDANAISSLHGKIQSLEGTLSLHESDLYSDQGGLHKDLSSVCDKQSVLARLDKLQALEREYFYQERSVELINSLKDQKFLDALVAFKDAIRTTCTTSEPLAQQNEKLESQIEALNAALTAAKSNFQKAYFDSPHISSPDSALVEATLKQLNDSDSEFRFWKKTDAYTWTISWVPGTYSTTGPLANELYENVGQKIGALRNALQGTLVSIFTHEQAPREEGVDSGLPCMLQLYYHCIAQLQTTLDAYRTKINTSAFDALTIQLLDYVNGLDLALVELRGLHELVRKCSAPDILALFKAQSLTKRVITFQPTSLNPSLQSFQVALAAFTAGEQVQAVAHNYSVIEPLNGLSLFAKSTAETVRRVYEKCVPEHIALTETDRAVWEHIIRGKPFNALYYENEEQEATDAVDHAVLVPHKLQTLFIKRACHALFTSQEQPIDSELELLLHVLKTNPNYKDIYKEDEIGLLHNQGSRDPATELEFRKIYKKNGEFMHAIVAYENAYRHTRNSEQVNTAYQILSHIFLALKEPRDVLSFAQILQRCAEFEALDKTSSPQSPHRTLVNLLYWNLDALADKYTYLYTSLTRAFACFLYGTDEKEKEAAEAQIHAILTLDAHEQERQEFSDDTKQLLAEYTMERVFAQTIPFSDFEIVEFFNGPVEAFLEQKLSGFASRKIQHALYVLLTRDEGQPDTTHSIKNRLVFKMGEKAFYEWQSRYRTFLASSTLHIVFHQVLAETKNHPAATTLEAAIGKAEVTEWTAAATKATHFTNAFIRQ